MVFSVVFAAAAVGGALIFPFHFISTTAEGGWNTHTQLCMPRGNAWEGNGRRARGGRLRKGYAPLLEELYVLVLRHLGCLLFTPQKKVRDKKPILSASLACAALCVAKCRAVRSVTATATGYTSRGASSDCAFVLFVGRARVSRCAQRRGGKMREERCEREESWERKNSLAGLGIPERAIKS